MNSSRIAELLLARTLPQAAPSQLQALAGDPALEGAVYPASAFQAGGETYALVRADGEKSLLILAGGAQAGRDFAGKAERGAAGSWKVCPLNAENAAALRRVFPWAGPVSLASRKTTFGCGDRLGRATPGHLRAASRFQLSPVLAQQSIRELTLTKRTFQNVVDDVTFLVFQSGYTSGYGADADHL